VTGGQSPDRPPLNLDELRRIQRSDQSTAEMRHYFEQLDQEIDGINPKLIGHERDLLKDGIDWADPVLSEMEYVYQQLGNAIVECVRQTYPDLTVSLNLSYDLAQLMAWVPLRIFMEGWISALEEHDLLPKRDPVFPDDDNTATEDPTPTL
jgi:hypothetical protein